MSNELLTTEQVAEMANRSVWTVARDVRAGLLTPKRMVAGAYLFAGREARRYAEWKSKAAS